MTRTGWIALGLSLTLNILLLTVIVAGRTCIARQQFALAELNSKAAVQFNRYVLDVLESNDPAEINQLKQMLKRAIDEDKKATEAWQRAVD